MFKRSLILLLPLAFYVAALNPYLAPSTYDNLLYFEGGRSLANSGQYLFFGTHIVDWPPLFSLAIAALIRLGLDSVWAAKGLVVACAGLASLLSYYLLERENRAWPLLACCLSLVNPCGLIWGSRIMSEWPFALVAMACLLTHKRSGLLGGFLLGAALLTRYAAAALVVALVAHELIKISRRGFYLRPLLRPLTVLSIGLGLFIFLWILPVRSLTSSGQAEAGYYGSLAIFQHFAPLEALFLIPQFFFRLKLFTPFLANGLILLFGWAVLAVLAYGFWRRVAQHGFDVVELFCLSTLAIISLKGAGKEIRYLLPIAPFLCSYFLDGAYTLAGQLLQIGWRSRVLAVLCVGWILALVAMDGLLLTKGNRSTYSGLSYWASPTAQRFYRKYWKDLYIASNIVRHGGLPGPIALSREGNIKYVRFFSRRPVVAWDGESEVVHLIYEKPLEAISVAPPVGMRTVFESTNLTLYGSSRAN